MKVGLAGLQDNRACDNKALAAQVTLWRLRHSVLRGSWMRDAIAREGMMRCMSQASPTRWWSQQGLVEDRVRRAQSTALYMRSRRGMGRAGVRRPKVGAFVALWFYWRGQKGGSLHESGATCNNQCLLQSDRSPSGTFAVRTRPASLTHARRSGYDRHGCLRPRLPQRTGNNCCWAKRGNLSCNAFSTCVCLARLGLIITKIASGS